jgi:hypothetical protein
MKLPLPPKEALADLMKPSLAPDKRRRGGNTKEKPAQKAQAKEIPGVRCAAAASRQKKGEGMDSASWLLLFLCAPILDGKHPRSLEPLRIMKGMFLATRRAEGNLSQAYQFRAYDYGPFTPEIYRDLDDLVTAGFVAEAAVPGRSWRTYRPTVEGLAWASRSFEQVDGDTRAVLSDAYSFVTSRGFLQLLRDIYAEFPEYAVKSVVKEATAKP